MLNTDGKGMGIDFHVIKECLTLSTNKRKKLILPSAEIAERIIRETGLLIASEIMLPHIQLPFFAAKESLQGQMLVWNPSVEQLGWPLLEMSMYAVKNDWQIGIKHSKFLGKDPLEIANNPDYSGETSLEKTLLGLTTFITKREGNFVLIHRGVDVPAKGNFRNALVHEVMKRIKLRVPEARIFFDPSHSYGPKMRHKIIEGVIEAMQIKVKNDLLYDGILIEAGTSPTDTDQHITIKELQYIVDELSIFRNLRQPKN
jgi:hypothetical protein